MHKVLNLRGDRETDCICPEKKDEEDQPALRIALLHRYKDL